MKNDINLVPPNLKTFSFSTEIAASIQFSNLKNIKYNNKRFKIGKKEMSAYFYRFLKEVFRNDALAYLFKQFRYEMNVYIRKY